MRRRALLGGSLALLLGCGTRERPALPRAPRVTSAEDLVPADLDVVARIDLSRIKSALGALASAGLVQGALDRAGGAAEEQPEPLLRDALQAADRVYLAYRPGPTLLPTDRVLIVEGRFEPLSKPPSGFGLATDLGADLRYWERKPGGPLPRAATARVYAQGDRLLAFVSEAEIDAVERALATPPSSRRLLPPAEGALSLAARPSLLARFASGSLRELLERARALQLVFDLESDRARLKATLLTASAEDAEALRAAGESLLGRLPGRFPATASLVAVEDRLVLSASAGREALAPLLHCVGSSSESACAW